MPLFMLQCLVLEAVLQQEDKGNQFSIIIPRILSNLTKPKISSDNKYSYSMSSYIQSIEAVVN